jgi:hypothetical protein
MCSIHVSDPLFIESTVAPAIRHECTNTDDIAYQPIQSTILCVLASARCATMPDIKLYKAL